MPETMPPEPPAYLTTREVAELLRVRQRKVYDLAASGELPCRRVTGKLLFPRAEIEAWLEGDRPAGGATAPGDRPAVLVGSHDPLLDWALRASGSGLAAFMDGSLDGLARMRDGEAIASGLHLPEAGGGWNRDHVREALPGTPVVLVEWAWRQQGLVVAAGNPLGIDALTDLAGRRFVPRQPEAGTHVLLGELLAEAGMERAALDLVDPPARTQTEVAQAVTDGKADAGLGLESAARAARLGFVPLRRERFDLVVDRRAWFEPPFQALLAFCRGAAFLEHAAELGGYDVAGLGTVHYNGP